MLIDHCPVFNQGLSASANLWVTFRLPSDSFLLASYAMPSWGDSPQRLRGRQAANVDIRIGTSGTSERIGLTWCFFWFCLPCRSEAQLPFLSQEAYQQAQKPVQRGFGLRLACRSSLRLIKRKAPSRVKGVTSKARSARRSFGPVRTQWVFSEFEFLRQCGSMLFAKGKAKVHSLMAAAQRYLASRAGTSASISVFCGHQIHRCP